MKEQIAQMEARYKDWEEKRLTAIVRQFGGVLTDYELKQVDLSELGSQGVVSEILNGKRDLNLRQVKALSERFKVPASVFI